MKRGSVAWALWVVTGLFGGHRFYLDRPWTGLLMLFTVGLGGAWWLLDAFLVRRMTASFNRDQHLRRLEGRAPRQLAFMPPRGEALPPRPHWAAKRGTRLRLAGDAVLLAIVGAAMGRYARESGNVEALAATLALIAITLLGTRWDALARLPVLRGFDRWAHRLRLFYYANDPGGGLSILFRQIIAVIAIFRKRRRAEVKLYLQLGAWFTILFFLVDFGQAAAEGGLASVGALLGAVLRALFGGIFTTFFSVYAFTAPVGAIINKHMLLRRGDRVIWALAALALVSILAGLLA